ncbi:unnamed protein product [Diplocarpon coronariae]|uniref:Uncharacterized protein n=1 Tax=Diplocarpon coronariae TaxID=2795749 RepID=A0A218ZD18_9HELO|nr:hypothetical protein B2J93_616 [Marssonina coronariae]
MQSEKSKQKCKQRPKQRPKPDHISHSKTLSETKVQETTRTPSNKPLQVPSSPLRRRRIPTRPARPRARAPRQQRVLGWREKRNLRDKYKSSHNNNNINNHHNHHNHHNNHNTNNNRPHATPPRQPEDRRDPRRGPGARRAPT